MKVLMEERTRATALRAAGRIVLRFDPAEDKFVTHWQNLSDGGFYWGRYFKDRKAAVQDFCYRVEVWNGYEIQAA